MGLIMSLAGGAGGYETPAYEVVSENKNYQVRRYAPSVMVVAEEMVESPDHSDSALFSVLAAYIGVRGSASNSEGRAIKMTAPVLTEICEDTGHGVIKKSMAFILPRFFQSIQ